MTEVVFKAPKTKRLGLGLSVQDEVYMTPPKKKRTKEDFFLFVEAIMKYTNFKPDSSKDNDCDSMDSHPSMEDLRTQENMSPIDCGGSTGDSYLSETSSSAASFSPDSSLDKDISDSGIWLSGSEWTSSSPTPEFCTTYGPQYSSSSETHCSPVSEIRAVPHDDSWDLITCFCMKPYAGRPMIECSECKTWIHLSCAKIRKTNIPDTYTCQKCRDAKYTVRKSSRMRTEKRLMMM